jgi:hypothetical protein
MADAELEDAPWVNKQAAEELPDAPWASKTSPSGDIIKTTIPDMIRSGTSFLTAPGTISDLPHTLAMKAAEKGILPTIGGKDLNKFVKDMDKLGTDEKGVKASEKNTLFPSYGTAINKIQEHTGPLPEPETLPGKLWEAAIGIAPGVATGGEAALPTALKIAGGATGQIAGGAAGKALEPHLPTWAQPFAEGAGEFAGTGLGMSGPAMTRRAYTPLPVSPQRAATINALRGEDFPMTAGQATGRQWLMNNEGRVSNFADMPQRQAEAFTQGVRERSGSAPPGPNDTWLGPNTTGADLGALRTANAINPAEAAAMQQRARAARTQFATDYGGAEAAALDPAIRAVSTVRAPAMNIPGTRYEMVRGQLQDMADAASGHTRQAIGQLRGNLDQAFYNSVPPDVAQRARDLQTQYANYQTIRNIQPQPGRATVEPREVLNAASGRMGRGFVNEERGNLAPYTQQASSVMHELPPRSTEIPELAHLASAGVGGAVGGAHGVGGGLPGVGFGAFEGMVGPYLTFPHAYNFGRDVVAKGLSSVPAQAWLGNNRWLPGPNTRAPSIADLVRVLATKPPNEVQK